MLSRIVQSEIHVICSCNFLKFHVIYVNSCQIMSSMSIQVNSCQFMSTYVNSCHSCHLSLDFSRNSLKWRGEVGRVKYVFLGLRRQLRCQAKGKNRYTKRTWQTVDSLLPCDRLYFQGIKGKLLHLTKKLYLC
jgi:hypothetical protein